MDFNKNDLLINLLDKMTKLLSIHLFENKFQNKDYDFLLRTMQGIFIYMLEKFILYANHILVLCYRFV